MSEQISMMPEQRVHALAGMVDEWIKEFEVSIDPGENPMYKQGAAKDLYPFSTWQEGARALPDRSGFWNAFEAAFPETEPKGPEDVRAFIQRLNEELPDSIRVVVVPQNLSEYRLISEGREKQIKALSVGAIAGHYNEAEEGTITTMIGNEAREVLIAQTVPNSTSVIFVSETVLANPAQAIVAIAHEGGHEEELHQVLDLTDTDGNTHTGSAYHTEVYSALSGIRGALHYAKWFGGEYEYSRSDVRTGSNF